MKASTRVFMQVFVSLALIVSALALGLQTRFAVAQATNLAVGKPVTCSATPQFPCAEAVDGNVGTRWSSAAGVDPQWIYVDLGATYNVTSVVLRWEAAYATAFQIQTSANATTWTNVYSTTTGTGGVQTLAVSGAGRYVRMNGTARATQWGYSLWEFEVYGTSGGATNTPTRTSTPVSTLPDLTITSITYVGSTPPCANMPRDNVVVSNIGSVSAGSFVVSFGPYTQTVTALAAGQSLTLNFAAIMGTATATADSTNVIAEGNETNNSLTASLPAPTQAPTCTPTNGATLTRTSTPSITNTPSPSVNLALNKPVTCSSVENVGTPCTSAVDGNLGTRWSSAAADPQWIQIDLGATTPIGSVILRWEAAYATAFQLQVSSNATTWTTIYTTTTGTGGVQTINASASARYIRMYGTARATAYGYSLWEFEVYGSGGPTPTAGGPTATPTRTPTPTGSNTPVLTATQTRTATSGGGSIMLSYHAPAVASTIQDNANCAGCTADEVADMDMSTRWATEWADPQWIYLDLGASANITRVVLKWEAAYGKSYQIQVSNDAAAWTSIYNTTTGDGATDDLTLSGTGRYVRMYATVRGTAYGYSLFEFQVFGTGGAPQATPTPRPTSTPHGPWILTWSDEFNGPGIDTTNWAFETGCTGNGNGEWENYTNGANSAIQFDSQANSNVMIVEARQTNPTIAACNYSSSRMSTLGKREFTYGRIEARLKLPQTKGIWPAFWMMGNNIGTVGWPYNGEIDIMEHIGSLPTTSSGALHGPGYSGGGNIGGAFVHSEPVNLNYHIYAIEWSPDQIKWFVDNNNFLTITREEVETHGAWVYDHPFFILLNVAIGGAWPGPPDASSVFPQSMFVDYIRVYR